MACTININDDTGAFRTIHKAKGDEFENVLLLINPSDFNENTNLEFLFNPDMTKEEHRVYYVALSRAKKRLFIAIPPISERTKDKLGNIKFLKVENL
ncbi:3'-5' exonuclease [Clostridium senegalense]|uniref:3'-5' exonuclease n=1 Tax=Clostridium senegalense TaxID=1465809 RepID=UPI0003082856|nr:3'-5' exonuclease [Clostridium senegalense]